MDLESARIFRLIESGDNFVKYASPGKEKRARDRARARYERALELANRAADQKLVEQVRLRIEDLSRLEAEVAKRGTLGTGAAPLRTARSGRAQRDTAPSPVSRTPTAKAGTDPAGVAPDQNRDVGSRFPDPGEDPAGSTVHSVLPSESTGRVPPGQRVTRGWPVLHEGPIPAFDRASWRLLLEGHCYEPFGVAYDELKALPNTELRSDFHCVTGWSKLDNTWCGVQTKLLLQRAQPFPDAAYVLVHAEHGYTANLPLHVLDQEDAMVAWSHNGQDLAPEHGFPLRLLVPRLYGWKSVKWVRRIEFLVQDQRGFWETRGYHNRADPWREERYAYQEG